MSITLQRMVVAGNTLALNPESDTDFEFVLAQAQFSPIGARESITQVMGMSSGERTIAGTFLADSDFRTLEAVYRAAVPVPCTDFLGNSFTALIISLKPVRVNDIAHNSETVTYTCVLRKVPG